MKAHVLTGTPGSLARFTRGQGVATDGDGATGGRLKVGADGGLKYLPPTDPADQEGADELPPVEVTPTDNPALDGQLDQQPSERVEGFDADRAAAWIRTAAVVQEATGTGPKGINWAGLAAALVSGAGMGTALAGPAGAIAGAIIAVFAYWVRMAEAWEAAQPENYYGEAFNWMRSNLPANMEWAIWAAAPGVVAAGIPAIAQYIGTKMLMPETEDEIQADASYRTLIAQHVRGAGLAGQCIVDNDRFLWRLADGTAVPMRRLFAALGGYDAAKAFYTPTGVDYPLTRLMANPAGSTSADPAVEGIVSDGSGGVYMLKGALFVYEGAIENLDDSSGDSGGRSGGGSAALAALALLGFAAVMKTH